MIAKCVNCSYPNPKDNPNSNNNPNSNHNIKTNRNMCLYIFYIIGRQSSYTIKYSVVYNVQ